MSAEDLLIVSLIKEKNNLLESIESLKKKNLDYTRQILADCGTNPHKSKCFYITVSNFNKRLILIE